MNNKKSKKEICEELGVSLRTFERFVEDIGNNGEAVGSSHERFYTDKDIKQFKNWLEKRHSTEYINAIKDSARG